jgi:enoyl-CoA hydratase/carnithine racemase
MASEMLLFGRKLSSSEALACGLVSRVVRDGDSVVTAAVELAKGLTEAPLAQRTALLFKRVMLQGHLCSESVERAMNFEFDILDERLKNGEIFEAASQTLRSKQQQKAKL